MKDLIIVADMYDNEYYHVYNTKSDGTPWRKVFTLFVDDVDDLLGRDVSLALHSREYGSTVARFKLPEAQEVEAL